MIWNKRQPPSPPKKEQQQQQNKKQNKPEKKTDDTIRTLIAVSSHFEHFISSHSLSDVSSHWGRKNISLVDKYEGIYCFWPEKDYRLRHSSRGSDWVFILYVIFEFFSAAFNHSNASITNHEHSRIIEELSFFV